MSRLRVEHGAKRVRAVLGGRVVADTTAPLLVWEFPYYPAYYVPRADVADGVLIATDRTKRSPSRGVARLWTVKAGEREVTDAALDYPDSPIEELRDHIRFEWASMDAWFEEDEEVFVHPRNPYTRVDILASSRHVRIELDGVTVAESDRPLLLFETGLPTRYYLPKTDVRMDLAEPSDTVTQCPYKGDAQYWTFRTGDTVHTDIAWYYRYPAPESQKIAGRVAFLDERADVFVDGVRQERPKTHFG